MVAAHRNVKTVLKSPEMKPLLDWIEQKTPSLSDSVYDLTTKVFWILNGIEDWTDPRVVCPICGRPFLGKNVARLRVGYPGRCSVRCMNADPRHVGQVVSAQKRHVAEDPDFWQKRNEKSKLTKTRNGHAWNWTNREKSRATKLERYGDENFSNTEKARRTRYMENGGKWHAGDFIQKAQETCFRNNGFRCAFSENGLRSGFDVEDIRRKAFQTMRRNGSFGKSKAEDQCMRILAGKFGEDDVVRQYRSEKYPFRCDFYVKSLDLYIEFNGTWTHGFHPFDPKSPADDARLRFLIAKAETSEYYRRAVYVWTELDPKKRETARVNCLNFIEVWSVGELETLKL